MQSQYYYFVTGLPALSIDDTKSKISLEEFEADAKKHLTARDHRLLQTMTLPEDADELLRIIYEKESDTRSIRVSSKEFWQSYAEVMKQKAADPSAPIPKEYRIYPDFWHQMFLEIYSGEEMPSFLETQKKLLEAIYDHCEGLGNKFISRWFSFNRDLQNILIAINGRHHKVEYAKYLVGGGELVEKLTRGHGSDFGLGRESELFDELMKIWEQNNILYRERGYDIIRWKWIEDQNFFNYFNIDRILGYYAQLRILDRWLSLDPSLGKEVFHDTMEDLANSYTFPKKFDIKSRRK
jgi:hypothetical protein